MSERNRIIGGGLLLAALTLVAYWPATSCGFIWDDDYYIQENPTLRSLEGLGDIWFKIGSTPQYYPLVHTTYWIEYRTWGLEPTGYHVVNILLHALGAVLLWRVLALLRVPGAWVIGAIFALHPVHVESVAWLTERKNVLSGVFYFASALAFFRFDPAAPAAEGQRRRWGLYALSLFFFLLALLSKTVACSLPAAILLVLWWKRGRLTAKDILPLAPFFALGLGLGLLTAWMEKRYVGAVGAEWDLSALDRMLIAGRALVFYLGKLFYPHNLTFIYPRWRIDPGTWWQYIYPAVVIGVLVLLWLGRRRIGRGPLVAALFFAGTLLPALGFFDVYPMRYSFVADHFQYLASVGIITLAVVTVYRLFRTLGAQSHTVNGVAAACVLVVLGVLTWRQSSMYEDVEALWRYTIARNPRAWMAHNNLGNVLKARGQVDEAIPHYRDAIEIKSDFAEAYNNLGNALKLRGELEEAVDCYQRAIKADPGFVQALFNLGNTRLAQNRMEEAAEHYRAALAINPYYSDAYTNLGFACQAQGRVDEAVLQYERALALNPQSIYARTNLARAFVEKGRFSEAASEAATALELQPGFADAHSVLGRALLSLGQGEVAMSHLEAALKINPRLGAAHVNVGIAMQMQGEVEQAIEHYERGLALDPGSFQGYFNLANALLLQGEAEKAIARYRSALKLRPESFETHGNLGNALMSAGRQDEAIAEYERALEIDPDYAVAENNLGVALQSAGKAQEAIEHFQRAARLRPEWADPLRNGAWLLATHADERIREEETAVILGEKAARLTGNKDARVLDALAAAYAASGRFPSAVKAATAAQKLARDAGDTALAEEVTARLELYHQERAYRQAAD